MGSFTSRHQSIAVAQGITLQPPNLLTCLWYLQEDLVRYSFGYDDVWHIDLQQRWVALDLALCSIWVLGQYLIAELVKTMCLHCTLQPILACRILFHPAQQQTAQRSEFGGT